MNRFGVANENVHCKDDKRLSIKRAAR